MEIPILGDIIVLLALSTAVLLAGHPVRLPTVVGFLITGVAAGPHGFGLIHAVHEVEVLAEIGVVLLLFTIGLEFSLSTLLQVKRSVFLGGALQTSATILALAFLSSRGLGLVWEQAVFIGFLGALSSTAIVLKVLQERAEIESPSGRLSTAILIFQDLAVVPMMLLVPLLAGGERAGGSPAWVIAARFGGLFLLVVAGARWIVPAMLGRAAGTRNREVFLTAVLFLCLGVAFLTQRLGLSLALGAFLAGLIISESEYSHQALGNMIAFRDVFTGLFFISIGMLLDPAFLIAHLWVVLAVALLVMLVKSVLIVTTALTLGFPLRIGILSGTALCQVGEFSFVLAVFGLNHHLLSPDLHQYFMCITVVSMSFSPFLIHAAPRLAGFADRLPLPRGLRQGLYATTQGPEESERLSGHLIIAGFGFTGKNLAGAAEQAGIPYVVMEMNPETVRRERRAGRPIFYGDASQESALEHAGAAEARVLVLAIPDAAACRRAVGAARSLHPGLHIVVRTRFVSEMQALYDLGADVVIPEEFETSMEIFTRVLHRFAVPPPDIVRFITRIRSDGYRMLRSPSCSLEGPLEELDIKLPELTPSTVPVRPGSPWAEQTLAETGLRQRHGLTVLAIQRDNGVLGHPDSDTLLHAGDILYVVGKAEDVAAARGPWEAPREGDS